MEVTNVKLFFLVKSLSLYFECHPFKWEAQTWMGQLYFYFLFSAVGTYLAKTAVLFREPMRKVTSAISSMITSDCKFTGSPEQKKEAPQPKGVYHRRTYRVAVQKLIDVGRHDNWKETFVQKGILCNGGQVFNRMDALVRRLGYGNQTHFIMMYWGACTLIAFTVAITTMGSSLERQASQNNYAQHYFSISSRTMKVTKATSQSAEVQSNMSVVVGIPVDLNCPQHSYVLAVWEIYLKNGIYCYVSYNRVSNLTKRNCSENLNWVSRPDRMSALRLKSPQFSSEGLYVCSIAYASGTFTTVYILTVLAPPEVSLIHTVNGTAVCKAAAGKPAAQISWATPGDYDTMNETLHNGTETVISTYNTTSANVGEVVCIISHPAWKKARILNLSSDRYSERRSNATVKILYSTLSGLLGILVFSLFIYAGRLFCGRQMAATTPKSTETISTRQSIQDNELEPYATFVQVENMIYDKAGELVQV